jgi:hypothetical protein
LGNILELKIYCFKRWFLNHYTMALYLKIKREAMIIVVFTTIAVKSLPFFFGGNIFVY